MLVQTAPPGDGSSADVARTRARCEAHLDDLLGAGLVERIEGKGAAVLRLPGPVRLFASDALAQRNELGRAAAAHARSLVARLATDLQFGICVAGDDRGGIELELDELRAALKWSVFNDRFEIGIALIEASASLWRVLSLATEYVRMIRIVLTRVSASASLRTREEMRLWKALANELLLTQGPRQETTAAWRKLYELASACSDDVYRRHALAGLIGVLISRGADASHVVIGGGVVVEQPLLFDAFVAAMSKVSPASEITLLRAPPVNGALAIAERLRAEIREMEKFNGK